MSLEATPTVTLTRAHSEAPVHEVVPDADSWAPPPTEPASVAGKTPTPAYEDDSASMPAEEGASEHGSEGEHTHVNVGTVSVDFDDAFDACVLGRVLWLLRVVAAMTILHIATLATSSGSLNTPRSATDALVRASDVVFLDVLRMAFVLLGFGGAYLNLISPTPVFSELAHTLLFGLVVDNLMGTLLACFACLLDALLTDAFDWASVGVTLLEAVLHTHLGFAFWGPGPQNLNPFMWVHYALLFAALAATRGALPFDDSGPARAKLVQRMLLGAGAAALATSAAHVGSTAHAFWFYSMATTPLLRAGELAAGVLIAYATVLHTEHVQDLARAWRRVERPLLLLVLSCWAFELGRPWALPPWPAPDACLRFERLAPCMHTGLLYVPRPWFLAASAISAAVQPIPPDTAADPQTRHKATRKTVGLVRAVDVLSPCAALGWPTLCAAKLVVRVAGAEGLLADNGSALVLGPLCVYGALRLYSRFLRARVASRLMHTGSHLLACLHFSRRGCCGAA